MRFKILNSDIFPVPNNTHMLHLGSIGYGLREFMVMVCIRGPHSGRCYIEEVVLNTVDFKKDVFANLKFIDDDNLAFDLAKFVEMKGITDMKKRTREIEDMGKMKWLIG